MEGGVDLKVGLWLSTRVKKDNILIKALFAYMLIHVIFCKHPCIKKIIITMKISVLDHNDVLNCTCIYS